MHYTAGSKSIKSLLMKLRTKYIIFMAALHLVCLVMSYFIFEFHKLLFILAEAVILVSIVISLNLYKQLINPLVYLKQGVNAIKDQDFNVKFLATGQKEVDELVDVYNRMIDELRTERTKQQEQHFFLEKLIQTSPTGIVIFGYDGEVKQINPKAEEIISASPNLLEQLKSLQIGDTKIIRIGGLRSYKVQKSKFIDCGFERVFMMIAEVTAEIFEAEKKVYSKVIRMMAHEVNNTVGPVNSIMNSALTHQQNNPVTSDQLLNNALQVAIDRNQNLNIFMRNFADLVKLPQANKKQIDLVSLVKSLSELMLFSAREKQVKIELVLPDESYYIQADAQLLEQALINILKNAMEAIELQGLITITLNSMEHRLIITDNGGGIAKGHAEQLFSPFFSTKKDGQGIGLTLVREILLNHGFEFSLNTESGLTKFSIVF